MRYMNAWDILEMWACDMDFFTYVVTFLPQLSNVVFPWNTTLLRLEKTKNLKRKNHVSGPLKYCLISNQLLQTVSASK